MGKHAIGMASNVFPYGKFDLKTRKEKGSRILNNFHIFMQRKYYAVLLHVTAN